MNDVQARDALAFMSSYELIDVDVLGTDGRTATFRGVVWDHTTQATHELGGVYTYGVAQPVRMMVDGSVPTTMLSFVATHSEVLMECLEACKYQRDLLRAKN